MGSKFEDDCRVQARQSTLNHQRCKEKMRQILKGREAYVEGIENLIESCFYARDIKTLEEARVCIDDWFEITIIKLYQLIRILHQNEEITKQKGDTK